MRKLTPPVKTALSFGACLIILFGLLNCFIIKPAAKTPFLSPDSPCKSTAQKQPVKHSIRREQMPSDRKVTHDRKATHALITGNFLANSKSTLVLPVADGPVGASSNLIELGSVWKGMAKSLGVLVTGEFWGYNNSRLWLRLVGSNFSRPSGAGLLFSFQPVTHDITIVQPIVPRPGGKVSVYGWLPSGKPKIPFKRIPIQSIPPILIPREDPGFEREKLSTAASNPRVAIVIDDVGYRKEIMEELLAIPVPLTWAILPFTPYSEVCRQMAHGRGIEIILHLPLETVGRWKDPGPGVIMRKWTAAEIRDQLEKDFNAVPGVVGVNNHMGSAGTQDQRLMEIIMEELKKRNLFFVDSMTHARSVAGKCAENNGVPFARRQVFIDNDPEPEPQRRALRKLIELAVKEGTAIGIAHARPGSIRTIAGMLGEFKAAGVEIVPVSELVQSKIGELHEK